MRTKPREERRADLMDAAQRLFLDQGVAPTTIEQITVGAQVAKGTFYLHFSSKEEVLAALRERYVQGLLGAIDTAVNKRPAQDWRGRLEAWASSGVAAFHDSIALHDIVFHEQHSPKKDEDNPLVAHLEALLEAGAAAGAWQVEDPRFTAVFLFNGYHGVVHQGGRLGKKLAASFLRAVGL
jgi:AcrR family transcriptional regulator